MAGCAIWSPGPGPGLQRLGVGRGDRVVALVPNGVETLAVFLAVASLGAIWSCSPDFGVRAARDRFAQIEAAVLIAVDGYRYGGSSSTSCPPYGFRWIADAVGERVQICSVSGGTDVCTAFLGTAPTVPVWLGELSCAALGANVVAYDEQGREIVDEVGELIITTPMPSMPSGRSPAR
jgi:acyl-coenzyme A synthetase/AMP-(fatty) acid ligase